MPTESPKRPDSGSSRSAWNDDGLDAPGRPLSSSSGGSGGSGGSGSRGVKGEKGEKGGRSASSTAKKADGASGKDKDKDMETKKQNPKSTDKKKKNKKPKRSFLSRLVGSIWSTRHTQELVDNETKAKTVLRELIVYLIFLGIVSAITYGITNPNMYTLTKVMTDLFIDSAFPDTGNSYRGQLTQTDFWRFAQGPMLDGLYWEQYYNGENVSDSDLGYVYYENKLLGVPRLRQLRVRSDSCDVYSLFDKEIDKCYGEWTSQNNDASSYGLGVETAWIVRANSSAGRVRAILLGSSHINNKRVRVIMSTAYIQNPSEFLVQVTSHRRKLQRIVWPEHQSVNWVYHDEDKMNGTSTKGEFTTYPGAGYYQDLATTKAKSAEIVSELKANRWIDRGTRVVFLDFTMYNPNVNLFCIARLITEYPSSGGALSNYKFTSVKLLRYVTVGDYVIMGCEFVFIAYIFYYLIEELMELRNQGFKAYFTEFWNWMDVIVIVNALVAIVFNIYRTVMVEKSVEELLALPEQYLDFESLAAWQIHFNFTAAIMAFLAWGKIFKYISFNKTMTQLVDTIAESKKDLGSFGIMFFIVFFAFAQVGYFLFGTQVSDFKSIGDAILTQLRIILGDFNFYELEAAHYALGPVYFIFYIVFVFLILFNMFLAIINDSYSSVKAESAETENEFEVMDFFKNQYNKMLEKLNLKKDRISDIQDALAAADANDDKLVEYEEWKDELLSRGYKEQEIEEAFKKFDLDGNRVLDKDEQAAMLKALEEEKNAVKEDIDQVENKLGIARPTSSRPGSRARTARGRTARGTRAKTASSKSETSGNPPRTAGSKRGAASKVVSEVAYGEFTQLTRRVDRMEHSIGSIVSKIDTVLVKLESMERAKLRRREAMTQLLDGIAGSEDASEEMKREQMERLVREELERWDSDAVMSRPGSAASRPGTSKSRPGSTLR